MAAGYFLDYATPRTAGAWKTAAQTMRTTVDIRIFDKFLITIIRLLVRRIRK